MIGTEDYRMIEGFTAKGEPLILDAIETVAAYYNENPPEDTGRPDLQAANSVVWTLPGAVFLRADPDVLESVLYWLGVTLPGMGTSELTERQLAAQDRVVAGVVRRLREIMPDIEPAKGAAFATWEMFQ